MTSSTSGQSLRRRMEPLLQAVQALSTALRGLGLTPEEAAVQARIDELDNEAVRAGLGHMEVVENLMVVSTASARLLASAINAAFMERGDSEHTCFRQIPPALMHLVSDERQRYWVCEHIPSHRHREELNGP